MKGHPADDRAKAALDPRSFCRYILCNNPGWQHILPIDYDYLCQISSFVLKISRILPMLAVDETTNEEASIFLQACVRAPGAELRPRPQQLLTERNKEERPERTREGWTSPPNVRQNESIQKSPWPANAGAIDGQVIPLTSIFVRDGKTRARAMRRRRFCRCRRYRRNLNPPTNDQLDLAWLRKKKVFFLSNFYFFLQTLCRHCFPFTFTDHIYTDYATGNDGVGFHKESDYIYYWSKLLWLFTMLHWILLHST